MPVSGRRKNAGIRKISVQKCWKKFRTFLCLYSIAGVEINFFNNFPVGQEMFNVYLLNEISTCPKKKPQKSLRLFTLEKKFVK